MDIQIDRLIDKHANLRYNIHVKNRQTYRYEERQIDGHTDRQIDKHANLSYNFHDTLCYKDRQTHRYEERQIDGHTDR